MSVHTLRLRQALLQLESELLDQEADCAEREKAARDLQDRLAQREAHIQELTSSLASLRSRISELERGTGPESFGPSDPNWKGKSLAGKIETCMAVLDGWCTPAKAEWLTRFIIDRTMQSVVEIGIFGGKSLVPITLALQETGGSAIGVEPWSNQTAVAEVTNDSNDQWWSTVDLAAVKARFFLNAVRFDVLKNLRVLEMDSDQAFALMRQEGRPFDMAHIDGAHSPERALKDAVNWSSLVRKGGVLIFDDIAWPSVAAARKFLTERFRVIDEISEPGGASYGAYQV